ncbi:ThiS family protein [Onchocerca flexuosa]|uniref:ThiS family protein n=1 Tax=Onchocerca flexuosa TaxID=387005 RepID=A0A238BTL3_9BILA|nr:ThiS family protein [Onchocerca flexuosa]
MATVPVHLVLFGRARELANLTEKNINIPRIVKELSPIEKYCMLALNQEYIDDHNDTFTINPHSEIAIIPPINGG